MNMLTLPLYSPEFNPTELVFNTLLMRLASVQAQTMLVSEMDFRLAIGMAMDAFDHHNVIAFYRHSGYHV